MTNSGMSLLAGSELQVEEQVAGAAFALRQFFTSAAPNEPFELSQMTAG
jgi:hypothetical protein